MSGETGVMRLYAVHLGSPNESSGAKIEKKYEAHHKLSPHLYLIRTTNTAQRIADSIDLGKAETDTGIVLKLNATYWGYYNQEAWDWLGDEE